MTKKYRFYARVSARYFLGEAEGVSAAEAMAKVNQSVLLCSSCVAELGDFRIDDIDTERVKT